MSLKTKAPKDSDTVGRRIYIVEAMVEYFISLMIGGAFLAKITENIGLSDSLTGILSAFVSLGGTFQLFALLLVNVRPRKRLVMFGQLINQLCFSLLYLVPVFHVSTTVKTVMLVVFLLTGYILHNVVNSPKINMFMEMVPENKRGVFTGTKEIVSLIGGVVYTYAMGAVIDWFEARGDIRTAFIVGAITLFTLTFGHALLIFFTKEKPSEIKKESVWKSMGGILSNKNVWKVIAIQMLYQMALYTATPFYGTYQNKELGFSMVIVSVIAIIVAVVRAIASRPIGRISDKKGCPFMLNICYGLYALAFAINIFTVPSNGIVLFIMYSVIAAVAAAGTNNSLINFIYSKVPASQRMGAFAVQSAISGVMGFLTTVVVSRLVTHIQNSGNTFLGLSVYAQQVVSALAVLILIANIVFMNIAFRKKKASEENQKKENDEENQEKENNEEQL